MNNSLAWVFLCLESGRSLGSKYGVNGIPCLVVLDREGKVVTTDGRGAVLSDPKCERFPDWAGTLLPLFMCVLSLLLLRID